MLARRKGVPPDCENPLSFREAYTAMSSTPSKGYIEVLKITGETKVLHVRLHWGWFVVLAFIAGVVVGAVL